ncbi:MAG: hypothetical protein HY891_02050 [Deltaproteobacteria bacterium]|nr:hypothetical protein [Deltaproteobacteria bacterium]
MGIDWKAVKEEFGSGSVTIIELAKKYGLHRNTIGKRVKKEGWRKKDAFEGRDGQSTTARKPEDLFDDHRVLWKGVKKRLVKGLHNNDVKLGLEELKVAKMAGEVLSSVIKGERLAWGIEDDASVNLDDTEKIAAEMDLATIPGGTDEAVDGE